MRLFDLFTKNKPSPDQLDMDYRLTFSSESGVRVLQDLCKVLHLMAPSYDPTSEAETAFREGERNALLYIFSRMKHHEESTKEIIEEVIENG